MVVIDGKPLILYTVVVKKKKVKSNEEDREEEAESEGDSEDESIWTEAGSSGLEGECHILWLINYDS